jgi:hypothetical protein
MKGGCCLKFIYAIKIPNGPLKMLFVTPGGRYPEVIVSLGLTLHLIFSGLFINAIIFNENIQTKFKTFELFLVSLKPQIEIN